MKLVIAHSKTQPCSAGFRALMPRGTRFVALFEKHAAIVVAGAEALRGLLQGGDTVDAYCQQIFESQVAYDFRLTGGLTRPTTH